VILIDTNIFMYAAGAKHPYKEPSVRFLEEVTSGGIDVAIDAEVLQEILHRYFSAKRAPNGGLVYDLVRRAVPLIIPITADIMDGARSLLDRYPDLKARDALHAAVAKGYGIRTICSYDGDFDQIEGLQRMEP
jgi:uncharacterized protein